MIDTRMTISLREIQESDAQFATDLRNQCAQYFFDQRIVSVQDTKNFIYYHSNNFFIIEHEGQSIGTISLDADGEVGHVAILPALRKQGVLKEAMKQLEKIKESSLFCQEKNFYVSVRPENTEAIEVYKKLGFSITKIILEKI